MRTYRTLVMVTGVVLLTAACSTRSQDRSSEVTATDGGATQVGYTLPTLMRDPLTKTVSELDASATSIKLVEQGKDCYDLPTRLQADIATGNAPHLALLCLNALRQFIDSDVAQPIDEFIADDPEFDLSQFNEVALEPFRHDGKLYGLPNAVSVGVLYYNADLFQAAGLDPDVPPETWTEFFDAARALDDPDVNRDGARWILYPSQMTLQGLLYGNGGSWLTDDETDVAFNQPQGVEAAEFLSRLQSEQAAQIVEGALNSQAQDAFVRGETAMLVDSSATIESVGQQAPFDMRIGALPRPDDGTAAHGGQGMGFLMFAESPDDQAAAWEAMKELTSAEAATDVATLTGFLPANAAAVQDDALLGDYLADNPDRARAGELIVDATPVYEFPGSRSVEIATIVNDALLLAARGEQSPQQALDDAAEQVRPLLGP